MFSWESEELRPICIEIVLNELTRI